MARQRRRGTPPAGSRSVAVWIRTIAFLGLNGLILITPFFRGLYFTQEQLVALAVALGLLLLVVYDKFGRRDGRYLFTWLDLPVWLLWVAYLLSTFTAAEPRAAVQEDAKYLLYALVYWLVRELVVGLDTAGDSSSEYSPRRFPAWILLAVLVATGFGAALVGIGAVAGDIAYKGAYSGNRIFSVFQYPNTTASYLTAVYFAAAALWSLALEKQEGSSGRNTILLRLARYLLTGLAAAVFFVFVFTLSRGAWLVFPVVALVYWLLLPGGRRLGAFLFALATVGAFIPAALLYNDAVTLEEAVRGGVVWRAWLVAPLAALLLNAVIDLFLRLKSRARILSMGALLGAGVVGLALALLRFGLPASVAQRLSTISLEEYNAWSRIKWSLDGFEIFKEHFFLGAGGGGWNALYHVYQSYGYSSTQVHNHFVQVAIETGIVGILAFLAIWVGVLWVSLRLLKLNWQEIRGRAMPAVDAIETVPAAAPSGEPELAATAEGGAATGDFLPRTVTGRILLAGVLAGVVALGLHAALDFNLSLSAVSIALWSLLALIPAPPFGQPTEAAATRQARRHQREDSGVPAMGWLVGGVALVFLLGSGFLIAGHARGQAAAALFNEGRIPAAAEQFQQATRYDPLTASFWLDLGQARKILAAEEEGNRDLGTALEAYRRGVELAPYNANYRSLYAEILLQVDYQKGIAQLEKAVEYHPYEPKRYENLAQASMSAAMQLLREGRTEEADAEVTRALALREKMRERAQAVPAPVPNHLRFPERTPLLSLVWGQALALQGEGAEARAELNQVDGDLRAQALLWQAGLARVADRPDEAERLGQEAIAAGIAGDDLEPLLTELEQLIQREQG